jgi:hypothetical protein
MQQTGALCCTIANMTTTAKSVRQSVSLPPKTARSVKALARTSRTSANRVLVELIESGLQARELERRRFFELTDRLAITADGKEQARIKEELARMTFGD